MMTNKEMMKQMVKNFGFEAVMDLAEMMQREIQEEEEKYKSVIPVSAYIQTNGKKIEFPKWVDDVLADVCEKSGVRIHKKNDRTPKNMTITCEDFAKFIIFTCNDNGITLMDIIEILKSAPAWHTGHGITRLRMEIVFHALVLHNKQRGNVKKELIEFLRRVDQKSLMVYANDEYRHVLNHDAQMMAYVERYICSVINEDTLFNVA